MTMMWPFVDEKPVIALRLVMIAELLGLIIAGVVVFLVQA